MAEYTIDKIKFGNNIYHLASGSTELPIASASTLGGIKVGSGLSINSTTGVLSATGGGTADSVDWQNVTSKPTTLAGYGITDAHISSGTITLGSNTITPLTTHQDISGKVDKSVTDDGTTTIIDNNGSTLVLQHNTGNNENSYVWLSSTSAEIGTYYTQVSVNNAPNPSTGDNYIGLLASNNSDYNTGVIVTPTQTIIKNIPTPVDNGDAANKKYVDDSVSGKANTATTLAGYGITDAKIANGTITLGSNTITPLTSYTESDPIFTASAAAGITSADIDNWNSLVSDDKTWNGATLNKSIANTSVDAYLPAFSASGSSATSARLTTVTHTPANYAVAKYDSNAQLKSTTPTAGDNSTTVATTAFVNTAISDKADAATTLAGYGITDAKIENGTITLGSNTITPLTSYTESDPVFSASAAAGITSSDITNWNSKIGTYGVTEIAANTDLNSVVDIGTHYCSAANVSTLSNCPTLQAFSMRVTATINPANTYHRQQEIIDVYGFRWVRDIVTDGTAAQHWKLLNILDRTDLSYFATSEIPVYGANTEQVCVLNQNVTTSTVSSAETVMNALCTILPANSNFRLHWTGNSYNESSYGGYRFGNIGAAMPQSYGALFIEKDYTNMALCKFIGYSPYTVWTGIWTRVNSNGWQGWIPTAQTTVSRLDFSDIFDTSVVTAYTSGTSSSNDYMTTYLDKDGRSVSGWICFKNVSATTAGGSGVTIGTLPEGWRPYRIFQVGTIPTTSDRRLLINKAGNIRLYTSTSVAANTVMYFKVDFIAVS